MSHHLPLIPLHVMREDCWNPRESLSSATSQRTAVYRSTATVATVSVIRTKVGSSYAMVDFLIIMRCIYPLLVVATLISFEGKESKRSPADGSNYFCSHGDAVYILAL